MLLTPSIVPGNMLLQEGFPLAMFTVATRGRLMRAEVLLLRWQNGIKNPVWPRRKYKIWPDSKMSI